MTLALRHPRHCMNVLRKLRWGRVSMFSGRTWTAVTQRAQPGTSARRTADLMQRQIEVGGEDSAVQRIAEYGGTVHERAADPGKLLLASACR